MHRTMLAAAAALIALTGHVAAQEWPTRQLTLIVPFTAGGGIDVILSAKRVGPTGSAYGLDMTDEMLALARRNADEAEVVNVHFLKGVIEQIPLPADSVDVVISNCVINLSVDKPAVLMEIARVLKPGGRLGVSDVEIATSSRGGGASSPRPPSVATSTSATTTAAARPATASRRARLNVRAAVPAGGARPTRGTRRRSRAGRSSRPRAGPIPLREGL